MKILFFILAFLAAAVFLSGCTQVEAAKALAQRGIVAKQQLNDDKAKAFILAPCDISIGSYWRALNKLERRAVDDLCGGAR